MRLCPKVVRTMVLLVFEFVQWMESRRRSSSSRKLGPKDQHVLQSLNGYKLEIWGRVIYRWKGLENNFPTVYYMPQIVEIIVAKRKKIVVV